MQNNNNNKSKSPRKNPLLYQKILHSESQYQRFLSNSTSSKPTPSNLPLSTEPSNPFEAFYNNFTSSSSPTKPNTVRLLTLIKDQQGPETSSNRSQNNLPASTTMISNKHNVRFVDLSTPFSLQNIPKTSRLLHTKSSARDTTQETTRTLESVLWDNFLSVHTTFQDKLLPQKTTTKPQPTSQIDHFATSNLIQSTPKPTARREKSLSKSQRNKNFLVKNYSSSSFNSSKTPNNPSFLAFSTKEELTPTTMVPSNISPILPKALKLKQRSKTPSSFSIKKVSSQISLPTKTPEKQASPYIFPLQKQDSSPLTTSQPETAGLRIPIDDIMEPQDEKFSLFMKEYTPYHKVDKGEKTLEGYESSIEEIFLFFSCIGAFMKLVDGFGYWKNISGQLREVYKEVVVLGDKARNKERYREIKRGIMKNIVRTEDIKEMSGRFPGVNYEEGSPFWVSKSRKEELSTFDNVKEENREEIMKAQVVMIKEMKRDLEKKKGEFKENIKEYLQEKGDMEDFEGSVLGFFEGVTLQFEQIIQEESRHVRAFYPSLDKYAQKELLHSEVLSIRGFVERLWESLGREISLVGACKQELMGVVVLSQQILKENLEIHINMLDLLENNEAYEREILEECMEILGEGMSILSSQGVNMINLEKINMRCGGFMRGLIKIKGLVSMEKEYEKNVEYSEKVLMLCEERVNEIEKKKKEGNLDRRAMENMEDLLQELKKYMIKASLCKDHFSEEMGIDQQLKTDFMKKAVELLDGLVTGMTVMEKKIRERGEMVEKELKEGYNGLVEEIKRHDNGFNGYVRNEIVLKGEFLGFENAGSHVIHVENFAKTMEKLEEKLSYYGKSFGNGGVIKRLVIKKLNQGGSFESPKKRRGLIFKPDIETVYGFIENFKVKEKMLKELFIFEDHFSLKNLEKVFEKTSSLTFYERLKGLYGVLVKTLERQGMLETKLNRHGNEFMKGFIKEVMGFEAILQKFLKICIEVAKRNLQAYHEVSLEIKLEKDYGNIGVSIRSLGDHITGNYEELLERILDAKHPIAGFVRSLVEKLAREERRVYEELGEEYEELGVDMKKEKKMMEEMYGGVKEMLVSIEEKEIMEDFIEEMKRKFEERGRDLKRIVTEEEIYLDAEMREMMERSLQEIEERMKELGIVGKIQGTYKVFMLEDFKKSLLFLEEDYDRNWENLTVISENLETRILQGLLHQSNRLTTNPAKIAIDFFGNIQRFLKAVLSFKDEVRTLISQEPPQQKSFFVKISKAYDKKLESVKEVIEELLLEKISQACAGSYRLFMKKVLKEEGEKMYRMSQEAQEFERLLESLEKKYYKKGGKMVVAEFLVGDYNEEIGFELEEMIFATKRSVNMIKELMNQREISSNLVLKKELKARMVRLQEFNEMLQGSLMVNKEVYIVKEKIHQIFTQNLQVNKPVEDLSLALDDAIKYFERTQKKITEAIKGVKDEKVIKGYMEGHVVEAIREIAGFLVKVRKSIEPVRRYYEERNENLGQKGEFLEEHWVESLKRGAEVHKEVDVRYKVKRNLDRVSAGIYHYDEEITREVRKECEEVRINEERILEMGKIGIEMYQYGMSLEEEYVKIRGRILENLAVGMEVMNKEYLKKEMIEVKWRREGREKSLFCENIERFIKGFERERFIEDITRLVKKYKEIEKSVRILRNKENWKKVEMNGIEQMNEAEEIWEEEKGVKVWMRVLEILKEEIEDEEEFKDVEELVDYVGSKVKDEEVFEEIVKENKEFFAGVLRKGLL